MSQEQPHGFDQAPIAALPPVFAHVDIAEHYQAGRFSSRLEAEIADIFWNGQPVEEPGVGTNPSRQGPFIAPQARDPQGSPLPRDEGGMQGEESPLSLTDEALAVLHNLNCIALIQGGQVLPLLDIEHMFTPGTAIERAQLYHSAARTLLDIVAAILEDRENRQ